MSSQNSLMELLWSKLQRIFDQLTHSILEEGITHKVGVSNNSSFPLRAYLSFVHGSGSEISIIVDVKIREDGYEIESDICCDDGEIIMDGVYSIAINESDFIAWLSKFEEFIQSNTDNLKYSVRNMQ